MDSICIGNLSSGDDIGNVKVGATAGRRTYTYCFIGKADVQALPVGNGINGYRFDIHLTAGTYNSEGDFAPVSD
jgi:hypothetical protein